MEVLVETGHITVSILTLILLRISTRACWRCRPHSKWVGMSATTLQSLLLFTF